MDETSTSSSTQGMRRGREDFKTHTVPSLPLSFDRIIEGRRSYSDAPLFQFPFEILAEIIRHIDSTSLGNPALVNRDCRQLARLTSTPLQHLRFNRFNVETFCEVGPLESAAQFRLRSLEIGIETAPYHEDKTIGWKQSTNNLRRCASTLETLIWKGYGHGLQGNYKDPDGFAWRQFLALASLAIEGLGFLDASIMKPLLQSPWRSVYLGPQKGSGECTSRSICGRMYTDVGKVCLPWVNPTPPLFKFLRANPQIAILSFPWVAMAECRIGKRSNPLAAASPPMIIAAIAAIPRCLLPTGRNKC
ncbi:hypothetical protein BDZ45DRAFT_805226 [Acephala macrosclerotiorum]|nr:hypothetical protein BDZ45DRAFT_805226 [Acephala macrosclerotiorum]